MSLLAQGGWFFNEWYWEPIFRTLKVLPFLGIVALVTAIVARGWIPSLGHRVWVAMGIIVSGTALTLGLGLYGAYERPVHQSRTVARTLGFTAYAPRPLPPPFVLESARPASGPGTQVIRTSYDAGDGSAFSTQARRRGTGGEFAGRCRLPGVRCREVLSPKGIRVLMGETRDARSVYADAVLGETLVTVEAVAVGEPAVLAYFDALRPIDPDELESKRGD